MAGDSAQLAVNTAEASNPSLFVSGWRPAVGWVCVLGLLVPMLGLGAYRTFEKVKGVAR